MKQIVWTQGCGLWKGFGVLHDAPGQAVHGSFSSKICQKSNDEIIAIQSGNPRPRPFPAGDQNRPILLSVLVTWLSPISPPVSDRAQDAEPEASATDIPMGCHPSSDAS